MHKAVPVNKMCRKRAKLHVQSNAVVLGYQSSEKTKILET